MHAQDRIPAPARSARTILSSGGERPRAIGSGNPGNGVGRSGGLTLNTSPGWADSPGMPDLRRHILRAMLGALALTAVAAMWAIAFSNDAMWRVTGTAFAGAIATLLMLKLASMVDEPRTRWAGLVGTVCVLFELLLVVLLIWDVHRWLPGDESELFGTMFFAAVATAFAMAFLKMLHAALTRVAGRCGLAITAASFVVVMVAVWLPQTGMSRGAFYQAAERLWGTGASLAGLGLLAVAALVGVGTGDRRHWRWVGVASSAVATCLVTVEIWSPRFDNEKTLAALVAVAVWVAVAVPLAQLDLRRELRWLRAATLAACGISVFLWTSLVWGVRAESAARAAAAFSVLTACGVMALVILGRLNRRIEVQELPRELRAVKLFCPRCDRKQTVPLGSAACVACGLRIEVKAAQPSCSQCGYLLYGGETTGRCPECGTPTSAAA